MAKKKAAAGQKLAIDGGPKAGTSALIGWPRFDDKAIMAVADVLRSGKVNYWTGPKGMEFEKKYAEWQGSKFAVSVATGTAALHVCLAALGIGPGDEVIVPSYTFIATSFAVVQAGAVPRFADVNLAARNLGRTDASQGATKRADGIRVSRSFPHREVCRPGGTAMRHRGRSDRQRLRRNAHPAAGAAGTHTAARRRPSSGHLATPSARRRNGPRRPEADGLPCLVPETARADAHDAPGRRAARVRH